MTIVRWTDPFREFAHLQDHLSRVLPGGWEQGDAAPSAGGFVPAVDIFNNGDKEVVLKADLPDMRLEDIGITVENGTLTLTGEKKLPAEVKEEQFHRVERRYGAFTRSFSLPPSVDVSKVGADYKNGVLTIRLPLREDAVPRQIKVDVAA
jgi:HSP20 family protein